MSTTRRLPALLALASLAFAVTAFCADDTAPHAPYPEGFLQWRRLKTTTLDPQDPQTAKLSDAHFIYANEAAVTGLRTGKYAEGAVFVLDILDLVKKDGVVSLSERASTSSMVRDASATETGGWRFEDYDIKTKAPLKMDVMKSCFNCHEQVEKRDYIFTKLKS